MRVAAIGDNCMDVYTRLGRSYPTGNAVDFAVHMQRLGIQTSFISTTGNDENGKIMIATLKSEGLDISHLSIGNGNTAITYMDMDRCDRIHGDYIEGVLENIMFTEDDIKFAGSHDLVHTAFWGKADSHLESIKKMGAKISFDYATKLDSPLVSATLPFVDYAFFSYSKPRDQFIDDYLIHTVKKGAKISVATLGENGSVAFDGNRFYQFGIFKASVINTVGAGDSFIAGFIRGILTDLSIDQCLKQGAKLSSHVVEVFEPWEMI